MPAQLYNLPSDRIKLSYVPESSGQNEEVELPLKLMVLGNYRGGTLDEPIEERRCISVNKHNFNEVLAESNVTFKAQVKDKLAQHEHRAHSIDVNLTLRSLQDFHPDRFAAQIPELATLIKFRQLLTKAKAQPKHIKSICREIEELLTNNSR